MPRIYSQAREVIVSLGEDFEHQGDTKAVLALTKLSDLWEVIRSRTTDTDYYCEDSVVAARAAELSSWFRASNSWVLLPGLFRSMWWHRIWIIPETVLAKNAVALFGPLSFSFNILVQAINAMQMLPRFVSVESDESYGALASHRGWKAAGRLMLTRSQWLKDGGLPITALIWRFRHHKCQEFRDFVFGFKALSREEDKELIEVNYRLSFAQVYTRLALLTFRNYSCLDVFSICSAYTRNPDFRSWVPDWRNLSERRPLVTGIFEYPPQTPIFCACGQSSKNSEFWYKYVQEEEGTTTVLQATKARDSLLLRGLVFDEVGKLGLDIPWGLDSGVPDILRDESYFVGRIRIKTQGGYAGLAPEETEVGDKLGIIHGGAVPYVLREVECQGRRHCYQLIGEW